MPRATLTVTVPEEVWLGAVSRAHPEARFRVLAGLPSEEGGVGLCELRAPDLGAVVADLGTYESVTDVAVLDSSEGAALLEIETSMPLLLEPARRSGVPLEMPFTVQNGEADWELTTSRERLSTLGEQFDALGISYTIDSIYRQVDPEPVLTEQQWRVVTAAVEAGYYDTPRETTLTDLAEELGIAKSTCSETLHRAEERIVKRFVAEHEAPGDTLPTTD